MTTAATPTCRCGHGCYCSRWGGVWGRGGLVVCPGEGRALLGPPPGAIVEVPALVRPLARIEKMNGMDRGYHVREGMAMRFWVCGYARA